MSFRSHALLFVLLGLAPAALPATASESSSHPKAPEWEIQKWINGDPGSVADNRGRVILIEFFQLWCPGCNRFSRPLFERWHERYGQRDDVLIVSIHTVFEGHAHQNPTRLRSYIADHGIRHPVGIDAYAPDDDDTPITMKRFRTRGTPQVAIVDKSGRIRLNRFGGFNAEPAEALIERLLSEPAPNTVPPQK